MDRPEVIFLGHVPMGYVCPVCGALIPRIEKFGLVVRELLLRVAHPQHQGHTHGMTQTETPKVVTAPELAALTGYDVATICRWARSGHLPSLRKLPGLRGPWLFDAGVLDLIQPK